jgi:hypothetical protein
MVRVCPHLRDGLELFPRFPPPNTFRRFRPIDPRFRAANPLLQTLKKMEGPNPIDVVYAHIFKILIMIIER